MQRAACCAATLYNRKTFHAPRLRKRIFLSKKELTSRGFVCTLSRLLVLHFLMTLDVLSCRVSHDRRSHNPLRIQSSQDVAPRHDQSLHGIAFFFVLLSFRSLPFADEAGTRDALSAGGKDDTNDPGARALPILQHATRTAAHERHSRRHRLGGKVHRCQLFDWTLC